MNKRTLILTIASVALLAPLAYAQESTGSGDLTTAANNISTLISTLTKAVYMLVFFGFFWFLAMYLLSKSDEDKSKNLKSLIISIVVIFVMTSIWGIVKVLQGTLGIQDNQEIQLNIPKISN